MKRAIVFGLASVILLSCLRPAQERAELDALVGQGSAHGITLSVQGGLAAVREHTASLVRLWAQAPVLVIDLQVDSLESVESLESPWEVHIDNCMPNATLVAKTQAGVELTVSSVSTTRTTQCRWEVALQTGELELVVAPPDSALNESFRFALMGDIQTGMDRVSDVFARMNEDPTIRFGLLVGDLAEHGGTDELLRIQSELEVLGYPCFAVVGNHDVVKGPGPWRETFGPFNFHFEFRHVRFSLLDSASGTLDPLVYDRLDSWLERGKDSLHIVAMHIPAVDPVGARNLSFRNRHEASKLLVRLGDADVDLLLYGHVHSYYAFSNGGIPAYISGGGGANPERLDGIGRHFLTIDVVPGEGVDRVSLVRVD
jgi:Icc protein